MKGVIVVSYNGSVPGPILKVPQGAQVTIHLSNHGDLDTTVHWHGLRLENRYDGVPHETQVPIPVGGSFAYRVQFPDPGLYWYHPHIREDCAQELGRYGNILVVPAEPGYWPSASREVILTLDDILVEDGIIAPFMRTETTHTAMGRFGNVLLAGGEPDFRLTANAGEVVRLWLANTASTRVFNVRVPGARMKLIGGDSGRVEHPQPVTEVLVAPSERAVVDVLVDRPGELLLEHRTPDRTYRLATISIGDQPATPSLAEQFDAVHTAPELDAERRRLDRWLAAPPDETLAIVAEMDDPTAPPADGRPLVYACPMHPEVTSSTPGRCPTCGMKLLATDPESGPEEHEHGHGHGSADGIEWEDDMAAVNRMTTTAKCPPNGGTSLVHRGPRAAVSRDLAATGELPGRVGAQADGELRWVRPTRRP